MLFLFFANGKNGLKNGYKLINYGRKVGEAGMIDRKKIINELRFQLDSKEVKDQHYPVQLSASDANAILDLLKEQEAVAPINSYGTFRCGNCMNIVGYNDGNWRGYQNNFCSKCGKAVKWNDQSI